MSARSSFLDRWSLDVKPRLARIRDTAMDHIRACEDLWEHATYLSRDTAELSAYASDMACGAWDFINGQIGHLQAEADRLGIAVEDIDFDTLELSLAASLWKARAESRRAA